MNDIKEIGKEISRLEALNNLNVLDSEPEEAFDALVKAASLVCNTPISLISLMDDSRQWFKANVGLPDVKETPRSVAFCAHAILQDDIFVVNDASKDKRFADNPLVTDDPKIRFYAGAPLQLESGENVGTLCVIDTKPHKLTKKQRETLGYLATVAVKALEDRNARANDRARLIAEQELRELTDQSAAIFRNSRESIIALTADGTITHWNPAAERLFGFEAEEMIGMHISKIVPKELNHEINDFEGRLKDHPEGFVYQTKRLNKQDEQIDVSVSLTQLVNSQGNYIGATKIVHDIREQLRTNTLLVESEAKYRVLSDASPLGVFSTDVSGACTYTNMQWQKIFDLSYEDSLGHGWAQYIHPEDADNVYKHWQFSALQQHNFDMKFRIRHRDNSVHHVHSRAHPSFDQNNNLTGYIGSVEDITEQQQILAKLAHNEERIRSIYESTPAMLQSIDPEGRLISVSDLWLEKHGYTREEVIGRLSTDFMTDESADFAKQQAMPMLMKSEPLQDIAYQKVKKNGEVFDVMLSSILERDENGDPLRSLAVLTDVTAEKAARRATNELLGAIREQFIMSITDASGSIIEVNDAFCNISQHSKEELIGKNHRMINSGYHDKVFFKQMWETIKTGRTWKGEICNRAKDGSIYWVDSIISPLKNNFGQVEKYLSIRTDITKRKIAELVSLEQKQQIQQIIENQNVATFMIDNTHIVTHWNAACELLTGTKAQHIIGQKEAWKGFYKQERPCLADLVLDNHITEVSNYYPKHGQSTLIKTGWHAENWFEDLGGKKRYVIFDAAPIFDKDGEIAAVIETLQDVTESKLTELALAKERQNLASVIEGTQVGTWQWNIATDECIVNDFWANMLGYELDELGKNLRKKWTQLIHPDDLPNIKASQKEHMVLKSEMCEIEFRMRHKEGHWIWVLSRGRVLSWKDNGKPEWMYGTHTNISQRVHDAEKLKHNEKLLSQTGTLAGIGGWELDLEKGQPQWTDITKKIHGVPPNYEPKLDTAIDFYAPEARPKITAAIDDAIETGKPWDLELPLVKNNGNKIWVRTVGNVEYEHGKPVKLYGALQDLTQTIEHKRELEALNQRVNLATHSAKVGIWDYSLLDSSFVWDDQMLALYGHKHGKEVTFDLWTNHIHPDDIERVLLELDNGIKGIKPYDTEFRILWNDNSVHHIRATATLNRDEDGNVKSMIGANWDITEMRTLAHELQQAYHNLEEFTAVASHDLKSPLRGIADLMEWINEDLGDDIEESIKNNLGRVQLRVKRMETLIEDLLQYSRAGRVMAEKTMLNPVEMVDEIIEMQPIPEGFAVNVKGKVKSFETTETPLKTSVRNLISNAIKHHDKDEGVINVKIYKKKSFCVFEVSDDGPGIPEASQERVFKLFQTLSKTHDSSGLGLAVSKRMIEAHGGGIELESNEEKRGTIFRIWWPICQNLTVK